MPNNLFKIRAAHSDIAEIDVFGFIGEDWFGEGNTLESVKKDIENIEAKTIIVNISSLGGDANEGFAIHNALRMHKSYIITRAIGPTASAGTHVLMAGDTVEAAENALLLFHNALTFGFGNAEDFREMAGKLDVWDEAQRTMYTKRIKAAGKEESELLELLKEDRWMSIAEAKEWGFVDRVLEEEAIAASVINGIKASKKLPQLPQNKFDMPINEEKISKNVFNQVLDWLKNDGADKSEEAIKAQANEIAAEIKAEYDEKITNLEAEKAELETSNSNIEAKMNEQIEAKETEIADLQAKISKLEGKPADPKPEKDPSASVEEEKPDPVAAIGAKFREQIYASNK